MQILDRELIAASEQGAIDLIKQALDEGADIFAYEGRALWAATENGHTAAAKLLLDAGADIHSVDDMALRSAAIKGHVETVKLLLTRGADYNALDPLSLYLIQKFRNSSDRQVMRLITAYQLYHSTNSTIAKLALSDFNSEAAQQALKNYCNTATHIVCNEEALLDSLELNVLIQTVYPLLPIEMIHLIWQFLSVQRLPNITPILEQRLMAIGKVNQHLKDLEYFWGNKIGLYTSGKASMLTLRYCLFSYPLTAGADIVKQVEQKHPATQSFFFHRSTSKLLKTIAKGDIVPEIPTRK